MTKQVEPPECIWLLRNEDGTLDDYWQMSTIEGGGDIQYTRVPVDSVAPGVDETKAKKLARRIIDAVINSPCVVEVRMFSQPEAVENLEDAIIKLMRAAASPAPKEEAIDAERLAASIVALWRTENSNDQTLVRYIKQTLLGVRSSTTPPAPVVSDCDPDA